MKVGKASAALLAAAVVGLDQFVKAVALRRLTPGISVDVIDGLLALRLGSNRGLAFGLLGGLPESWLGVVGLVPVVALVTVLGVARGVFEAGGVAARLAIGLVAGGAIGNLIDRVRFGAVTDFIDFYWRDYHWPTFNVADSAITGGVVLLSFWMSTDRSRGAR